MSFYLDRDTTDSDVFDAPEPRYPRSHAEMLRALGVDPETELGQLADALRAVGVFVPKRPALTEH